MSSTKFIAAMLLYSTLGLAAVNGIDPECILRVSVDAGEELKEAVRLCGVLQDEGIWIWKDKGGFLK